ncbi:protoheme IX farnesyltransferase [Rheinheimera pacifica]|uniref:heme o synthase n=1 Tax=Rheinheimera pacifica TaxID=173990 RepID=UPI0028651B0C|nr:heme o synthase [Rheinheimera pacifica]MDR6985314.1 protoheme IX farnesyltransferase [Rheinheimera pacifica]
MTTLSHRIGYAVNSNWRHYLQLCKPKVVLLLLITAVVGMLLAAPRWQDWQTLIAATVGIAGAAAAAAVFNHLADSSIDRLMQRTRYRPLVRGVLTAKQALWFAVLLTTVSLNLLWWLVNPLTAVLSFTGLMGYAVVYTRFLKYRTSQNIVLGGLSGALPPLLGWTSVTNQVSIEPLLLVLLIFVWTPAHFWPLAIERLDDYRRAKVPMLPVTHGVAYTRDAIVGYTLLLLPVSVLPVCIGMSGVLYLLSALLLGGWFLCSALMLCLYPDRQSAMRTFYVSIYYLFGVFGALLVDHLWRLWPLS